MGFKADTSFLKFLSMGAVGVHQTMEQLRREGFKPIELERYCGSNKIWATKVKRLRLPDLLCVKTGMRLEVRAKSKLEIKMSDAPSNPDRVWDAGLRDDDLVAFIACFDTGNGPRPADAAVFFRIRELRDSAGTSKLGPPKSASEGAERDRTWPSTVPSRDCSVLSVESDKIKVEQHADDDRPSRRQSYRLNGKTAYCSNGDNFTAGVSFLAGTPSNMADLASYRAHNYDPLGDLHSSNVVDRYAAAKSIPYRDDPQDRALQGLEDLINRETEDRVALEAAGAAAVFDSALGQDRVAQYVWNNEDNPEMRMEAVLILTELGDNPFSREQLTRISTAPSFRGNEIRQAAVWGLGKAGLNAYDELIPFIDDPEENVALHAIAAFGSDTPPNIIDLLVQELIAGDPRRAPAASEALRIIGSDDVLHTLIQVVQSAQSPSDWVLATLGRLPPDNVRRHLQGNPILDRISPMLLIAEGANWLSYDQITTDMSFLLKQNL